MTIFTVQWFNIYLMLFFHTVFFDLCNVLAHIPLLIQQLCPQFMQLAPYKNQLEESFQYSQSQTKNHSLWPALCPTSSLILIQPSSHPYDYFTYRIILWFGICQQLFSLALISGFPN